MHLKKIIDRITTCLPTSWPLQSFIAMNPLWDQVNQPISETLKELGDTVSIKGTLPLKQYHRLYQNNDVRPVHIKNAVTHWLQQKELPEIVQINSDPVNIGQSLCDFLLANESQESLETLDQNNDDPINNTFQNMGCPLDSDQIQSIRDALIKWCATFFDFGQAILSIPSESNNLFTAWRELVILDSPRWKKIINILPNDPVEAAEFLVLKLNIPEQVLETYCLQILLQIKGWASFIKWLQSKQKNIFTRKTASITDLITIWLAYEVYFIEKHSFVIKKQDVLQCNNKEKHPIDIDLKKLWQHWLFKTLSLVDNKHPQSSLNFLYTELDLFSIRWIWQTAWEKSYQDVLISSLEKQNRNKQKNHTRSNFQAIFCIDTRSEGLRRHLETLGRYETFSFAGFFGFPFRLREKTSDYQTFQSPPIIEPEIVLEFIQQQPKHKTHQQIADFFNTVGRVKNHGLATYALFELVGTWLSLKLIGKTFLPALYRRISKHKKSTPPSMPHTISRENLFGFNIDEATHLAAVFLKTIGLTQYFSKIVLICAHGASMDNNPYQSSFDCGACGGNAGTPNAMVACTVLNDSVVREKLRKYQIDIPHDTKFISGCHDTTIDTVDLFIEKVEQEDLEITLKQLREDLKLACDRLQKDRLQNLPGNSGVNNRQANWAELIPELGLANNAAMIIGPRNLTRGLNLNRRVFLHSYEPTLDKDGSLLEGILTGPVIIAHWINAQYYFSTTDPNLYGSGNKAIHNVVSKLGVMEGNLSDLKIGLPIQNVYFQDELLHQPLKLLVIIYAKRSLLDQLIHRHPKIKNLFEGQWAYLHVMEPTREESDV